MSGFTKSLQRYNYFFFKSIVNRVDKLEDRRKTNYIQTMSTENSLDS